jgi:hypothetical protein
MKAYEVLVLGPDGSGRASLEEKLRRMGHAVAGAQLRPGGELASAERYDVVVVDARESELDWRPLTSEGAPGSLHPLLLVSDQPRPLLTALSGRSGGVMVLTGAESDSGYQVALSVCAALRHARQPQAGPLVA